MKQKYLYIIQDVTMLFGNSLDYPRSSFKTKREAKMELKRINALPLTMGVFGFYTRHKYKITKVKNNETEN